MEELYILVPNQNLANIGQSLQLAVPAKPKWMVQELLTSHQQYMLSPR